MAAPPVADAQLQLVLETFRRIGTQAGGARELGMDRATFMRQLEKAQLKFNAKAGIPPKGEQFEVAELPDEDVPVETLVARRKEAYARLKGAKIARQLIPVKIKVDGPFGVTHIGDPHIDDNGTDIELLERHVKIIDKTDGLFAANVGDLSNNWVGRLARLYGEQSTSAREAWKLVEWLVSKTRWLYIVGGNHDVWSGAGDPIQWMSHQANVLYQWHGVRLGLSTPSGRAFRVNARHDFKGHSQWNTAHGPAKAAQMGWRDHVLTCGHLHTSGYQIVRDPSNGLISHAIRVGSYKAYDRYAEEKGLPNQCFTVAPTTIFDPAYPDDDIRAVTVIFDPEEAASYLTWKRKKAKVA